LPKQVPIRFLKKIYKTETNFYIDHRSYQNKPISINGARLRVVTQGYLFFATDWKWTRKIYTPKPNN